MPRTNRIIILGVLATLLVGALGAAVVLIGRGTFRTPTTPVLNTTPIPTEAPEVNFEPLPRDAAKFREMLVDALNARDEELLRVLATDDHLMLMAFWRPDGIVFATEPVIKDLLAFHLGETAVLTADPGRDLTGLLDDGMDPVSVLGLDVDQVSAYFVSGWGLNGEDEAILYIAHQPDGGLYWYGILIGPGGFAASASDKVSVANCAEPTAGTHQLIYAAKGVCFLYPETFDVFQSENGSLTLYVRSLLNTEAPLATVSFEPVDDRTMFERYKEFLPPDFNLDVQPPTINLGGETAVILDNLPGQDLNRRVVTVHDGTLVDIMIARIGPDYGAVGEQAEALYTMITGSFQFIGVEPEAPLLAGPECPQETAGMKLFTSPDGGFCVLLPEGYAVDDSLTTGDGGAETAVYLDSLLDSSHARLFITVEDANGRTLNEITQAREAEIESALPGFDVMGSFGHMLDGIPANQFEHVPGQDLSRQVLTVRDGRAYTLTFIPDDTAAGSAYTEMQTLYDTVMDSFSFLWQK